MPRRAAARRAASPCAIIAAFDCLSPSALLYAISPSRYADYAMLIDCAFAIAAAAAAAATL
jgi:hypothetical protein